MKVLDILNFLPFSPLALFAAYVLDLLIGDPEKMPHPVRWIGKLIVIMEARLRATPFFQRREKAAGIFLAIIVVAVTYALTAIILYAAHKISLALFLILSIYCVWAGLSIKSLGDEAKGVVSALASGGLDAARKRLSRIVGRDTKKLNQQEVLRATVETVAENTSDGIVAPLFFLAIGGPALMMAYKAVNTLDSMVGYKNEKYRRFGWFSAKLDDWANFIPARVTGALVVTASFILGYNWRRSAVVAVRDGRKHPSPNAGVPEAAVSGALGLMLGGSSSYGGVVTAKPQIGAALNAFDVSSVSSSIRLMQTAAFLMVLLTLLARTAAIFVF